MLFRSDYLRGHLRKADGLRIVMGIIYCTRESSSVEEDLAIMSWAWRKTTFVDKMSLEMSTMLMTIDLTVDFSWGYHHRTTLSDTIAPKAASRKEQLGKPKIALCILTTRARSISLLFPYWLEMKKARIFQEHSGNLNNYFNILSNMQYPMRWSFSPSKINPARTVGQKSHNTFRTEGGEDPKPLRRPETIEW